MPHCAVFNCSKDQQANVSSFRFPINDKKATFTLASCTKSVQTTTNRSCKEYSKLCSNHFGQDIFTQNVEVLVLKSIGWSLKRITLKPDEVPSVFDFQVRSQRKNRSSETNSRTNWPWRPFKWSQRQGFGKYRKKRTFSICKATEETGELYLATSVLQTKQNLKYLITFHGLRSNL